MSETNTKNWQFWLGWALSALPAIALVASGWMKVSHAPAYAAMLEKTSGFPSTHLTEIGAVELLAALLYLVPRTTVLGAILMTGYLGGAICVHVRVNDPGFTLAFGLGVLVWAGLWLRDARIRELLPLRK